MDVCMVTSPQGRALIEAREGCRLRPYQDSVGVWTDGVGNTHGVVPGVMITQAKADADLARNLASVEAIVMRYVKPNLERHQFDALVSFGLNIGNTGLANSWVVREINAGNMEAAAAAFDNWHIPAEISSRRNGEREQFKGTRFEARIP